MRCIISIASVQPLSAAAGAAAAAATAATAAATAILLMHHYSTARRNFKNVQHFHQTNYISGKIIYFLFNKKDTPIK